jgi:hypothetical protein
VLYFVTLIASWIAGFHWYVLLGISIISLEEFYFYVRRGWLNYQNRKESERIDKL